MSRIYISGLGAVSPAGWGIPALRAALATGTPLPTRPLSRPGWEQPLAVRVPPTPQPRPSFFSHPRLRRVSPITHYATAAALEALAGTRPSPPSSEPLGLVLCLQSGCVQYSYRFFEETLRDPSTASPLLFPETVFAAPASHVAALVERTTLVCTLVGDPATYLQGIALAADWLAEGRVKTCLVIGAEETNWLLADALWHFDHKAVLSGGAGAICLRVDPAGGLGVELERITSVHTYAPPVTCRQAARRMRQELPAHDPQALLCDGLQDHLKIDGPERAAWSDWTGARLSLKHVLGEGLMAAAAWQCVAACDAISTGRFPAASVSLVGCNQQAIGARFVAAGNGISDLPKIPPDLHA